MDKKELINNLEKLSDKLEFRLNDMKIGPEEYKFIQEINDDLINLISEFSDEDSEKTIFLTVSRNKGILKAYLNDTMADSVVEKLTENDSNDLYWSEEVSMSVNFDLSSEIKEILDK